ncbi:hypothetical protein [Streptomyces albireticuli]|nr:hypothetical protein [Streptomyces albireticuli]MCD9196046.1 hypothetical protein [Streptomyces albireticuli]
MAPADRLLDVLNAWLSTTAAPGAPVAARLHVATVSGSALFAKVSEEQVDRLGHLLATDDAVLVANQASTGGGYVDC